MHICYLDDSGDATVRAFSVISVPVLEWHECFKHVKAYRSTLKERYGIYVRKELHATEFVGGRGKISPTHISKEMRVTVYNECLSKIAQLPGIKLFNAIAPKRAEFMLFERLLNRINRTMKAWDSHALLISDEGKDYNKLVRKMGVYNPIPSQFGGATQNMVLDRIVDEILYKRSQDSHFIQIADFCAYALLRSEVPLPAKDALGINVSFERLKPLCQTQCYSKDPKKLGIIRT
jgi:hypothetical protein